MTLDGCSKWSTDEGLNRNLPLEFTDKTTYIKLKSNDLFFIQLPTPCCFLQERSEENVVVFLVRIENHVCKLLQRKFAVLMLIFLDMLHNFSEKSYFTRENQTTLNTKAKLLLRFSK